MKVAAILLLWGFVVCASFIERASSYPYHKPDPCGENEEYVPCGSMCPITCANRLNPPRFCLEGCIIGCVCKAGFMRNSDHICVQPENCSEPDPCGENEEYVSCGSMCPVTCANQFQPPHFCIDSCFIGCACKAGFMRNSDSACIQPTNCG